MKISFSEWVLNEAAFNPNPAQSTSHDYEALNRFWHQYKGSFVKFRDYHGNEQVGKLVDLLDEGVFVVQTRDGQSHDVHMEDIHGVLGNQSTPAAKWTPQAQQKRTNRWAPRAELNKQQYAQQRARTAKLQQLKNDAGKPGPYDDSW